MTHSLKYYYNFTNFYSEILSIQTPCEARFARNYSYFLRSRKMLVLFFAAFSWLCVIYVIYICVLLFIILLLDCDLILKFYEYWGAQPEATLRGKVAWITGASSGIGEELAYQLAKSGMQLVLSARGEKGLKRVAEKCKGLLFFEPGLKTWYVLFQESISLVYLDLSPANSQNLYMVLPMDMLETSCHEEKTAQVLKQFGKVFNA